MVGFAPYAFVLVILRKVGGEKGFSLSVFVLSSFVFRFVFRFVFCFALFYAVRLQMSTRRMRSSIVSMLFFQRSLNLVFTDRVAEFLIDP